MIGTALESPENYAVGCIALSKHLGFETPLLLAKWHPKNTTCYSKTCKVSSDKKSISLFRVIGLFSIISKGCDSSCDPLYQDFSVGNRNISCCSSDLCNVNAWHPLKVPISKGKVLKLSSPGSSLIHSQCHCLGSVTKLKRCLS
uniref:Snake toxin/toxin-like domain-containing protein n=1 Tax=Strigops habroptila TaxID=2489341 RepID=A0A672TJI9_STRHB